MHRERWALWKRVFSWGFVALWLSWLAIHVLALLRGGVVRVIAWYFAIQIVPMSALVVLLFAASWLLWRQRATVPHALLLVSAILALLPGIVGFGLYPVAYPLTSLSRAEPKASVRLPTDAEMVVVWGGDAIATNYHAMDPAQRWAYDLVIEPAATGASELSAYGCYGVSVRAPAAGRVTVAEDGHPDGDPAHFVPNYTAPAGNYVALEMQSGTYLVIAHLIPGSVAVSVGDEVAEGQVIGACGNSGNSSEPHIHLHHQRQDPALVGLVAEGLPLYFRDIAGRVGEVMPIGGVEVEGERVRLTGERLSHRD